MTRASYTTLRVPTDLVEKMERDLDKIYKDGHGSRSRLLNDILLDIADGRYDLSDVKVESPLETCTGIKRENMRRAQDYMQQHIRKAKHVNEESRIFLAVLSHIISHNLHIITTTGERPFLKRRNKTKKQ